jgi:hypothetical protein
MKTIKKYSLDELVRMRAKYDYRVMLNAPPFSQVELDLEIKRRKTLPAPSVQLSLGV